MRSGLDWYKREPQRYLGGVQGLTTKEHAVYSVVLDLIYLHGGSVNNDPKWIAGWISDMGSAAVRKAVLSLFERGKLTLDGDQITQKRAKNEAKTKEKLTETRRKSGKKGGEKSSEIRAANKENNTLAEPSAKTEGQPEKIREDNTIANAIDGGAVDVTDELWSRHKNWLVSQGVRDGHARSVIGKWLKANSPADVRSAFIEAFHAKTGDPIPYITKILCKPEQPTTADLVAQALEVNAKR